MDLAFVSSEFDIFVRKLVQNATQNTNVVVYKLVATIEKAIWNFWYPLTSAHILTLI
jgi:hypothetical protein